MNIEIKTIEDLTEWLDSDPDYDVAVQVITTCLDIDPVDLGKQADNIKDLKQLVKNIV